VKLNKPLRNTIKILVVAAIFFFLGRQTYANWEQVKNFPWHPRWGWLLLSFVTLASFNIVRSWAWGWMVWLVDKRITARQAMWAWIVSSYGRYIPGKIWLFIGKVYLTMEAGVSRKNATVAVLIELVISTVTGLLVALCFLPSIPALRLPPHTIYYLLAIIPLGLIIIHSKCMHLIIQLLARLTRREAGPVSYPYWQVLITFILFCGVWLWYVAGVFFLFKAFADIPFSQYGLFACGVPFAWFVGFVAVFTPDGLGVREGLLAYALSAVIPVSVATILVMVLRLWLTAIDLSTLGIVALTNRAKLKNVFSLAHMGMDQESGAGK
jgi:hypothetical protein